MPLPKAKEKRKDYVARFMSDPAMVEKYPDEKQRLAIAYSEFSGKAENAEDTYESIHVTMNAKLGRKEFLDERQYFVAPAIILREGVLNGSAGPLFYGRDEIIGTQEAWNHKPILAGHPTIKGKPASSCSPAVLEKQKVGFMLNSKADADGKLHVENWIDVKKAQAVDPRIPTAPTDQMIELSTGLFTKNNPVRNDEGFPTTATWNGKKYVAKVSNFRPDHLALLLDQTGAMSVADGAGFPRLNAENEGGPVEDEDEVENGGSGSGNFDHGGHPGELGGSGPGGGERASNKDRYPTGFGSRQEWEDSPKFEKDMKAKLGDTLYSGKMDAQLAGLKTYSAMELKPDGATRIFMDIAGDTPSEESDTAAKVQKEVQKQALEIQGESSRIQTYTSQMKSPNMGTRVFVDIYFAPVKKKETSVTKNNQEGAPAMSMTEKLQGAFRFIGSLLGRPEAPVENEDSFRAITQKLETALREKLIPNSSAVPGAVPVSPSNKWLYIEETFPESVVYSFNDAGKFILFKQDYSTDDAGNITLDGEPVAVERTVSYVPIETKNEAVDNGGPGSGPQPGGGKGDSDLKSLLGDVQSSYKSFLKVGKDLASAEAAQKSKPNEANIKKAFELRSEFDKVKRDFEDSKKRYIKAGGSLESHRTNNSEPETPTERLANILEEVPVVQEPTQNTQESDTMPDPTKPKTREEILAMLPEADQKIVANAVAAEQAKRTGLITTIKTQAPKLTDAVLNAMDTATLDVMAESTKPAPVTTTNATGLAPVPPATPPAPAKIAPLPPIAGLSVASKTA